MILHVMEVADNMSFAFEYCTKLFKEETIEIFINCFKNIAATVTADDGIKIKEIKIPHHLLTANENIPRINFGF